MRDELDPEPLPRQVGEPPRVVTMDPASALATQRTGHLSAARSSDHLENVSTGEQAL